MWSARAHEAKRVCSKVKHILTSEGKCKKLNPMTFKCTLILKVAFMQESKIFKALVEKVNKCKIGPPRYHWNFLKVQMPKVPLHCSFKFEMHKL
jgi:hypothetical protein